MGKRLTQDDLDFRAGLKAMKRVGTAHCTGDGLRAMYASLLPFHHGLFPATGVKFFVHLRAFQKDPDIEAEADMLLRDRAQAVRAGYPYPS